MADYQLTQTGDEVQDILDNAQSGKYFYNQSVATWASDATYSDYPYKGTITLNGVKGTDGVEVTFSNADATSGNYAPICNTVANGVEIWAKAQDNALTIPTIHITTGADVQLSGADAYLPISGGNITGSLSVVGNTVLTTATGSKVAYADITVTADNTGIAQIAQANISTFIGGIVIDSNSVAVEFYTYSNIIHAYFHDKFTYGTASTGSKKVRVWYIA
jgi:hypothetical protein